MDGFPKNLSELKEEGKNYNEKWRMLSLVHLLVLRASINCKEE